MYMMPMNKLGLSLLIMAVFLNGIYGQSTEMQHKITGDAEFFATEHTATQNDTTAQAEDCQIWLGNNYDWNDAANWSQGVLPNQNQCVIIPASDKNPIITNGSNAFAYSITVEPGGGLQIYGQATLFVTDFVKNQAAPENFLVKNNGNLIQSNDNAVNSGEISAQKLFNFSDLRKQYNLVISPLIDQKIKTIYPGNPRVLYHSEATDYFYEAWDGNYIAGKGFAIKEPSKEQLPNSSHAADFVGEPYNGVLNYPLSYTTTNPEVTHGYNLVGNPYPSGLDLKMLYNANSDKIGSTFLFWDNRGNALFEQQGSQYLGGNYAQYNAFSDDGISAQSAVGSEKMPTGIATVGTAFMLRANEGQNNASLQFKNSFRTNAAGVDFFGKPNAKPEKDSYHLVLITPEQLQLMTAVVYGEHLSNAYGPDDSDAFGNELEIYTMTGEHQLAIHGRSSFVSQDELPLGVRIHQKGVFIISLNRATGVFTNGQQIYLKDRFTGITHNLTTKAYKFNSRAGEFNDRFVLVYKPAFDAIDITATGIQIQKQNNQIVIKSPTYDLTQIGIFSLSGELLYSKLAINAKELTVSASQFKKQIVFISVTNESGERATKKIYN